jgi:hypothetical protein
MSSTASESTCWQVFSSLAALVLGGFLSSGCISMTAPPDFLVLEDSSSREWKAVTPDDAKILVREFGDGYQGDLKFWSEVVKKDFIENRGYTLIQEGKAKGPDDREGTEFLFECTVQARPQRYMLSLFVIEGSMSNTVCTVEYVAPKDVFEKHLENVKNAILTLKA